MYIHFHVPTNLSPSLSHGGSSPHAGHGPPVWLLASLGSPSRGCWSHIMCPWLAVYTQSPVPTYPSCFTLAPSLIACQLGLPQVEVVGHTPGAHGELCTPTYMYLPTSLPLSLSHGGRRPHAGHGPPVLLLASLGSPKYRLLETHQVPMLSCVYPLTCTYQPLSLPLSHGGRSPHAGHGPPVLLLASLSYPK